MKKVARRRPRTGVAVILSAFPSRAAANRAARELVRDGDLACATVAGGATAFYFWEGKFVRERSTLLWGKTSAARAARAVAAIRAVHPDRVPEILIMKTASALPAYAAWVAAAGRRKR